MGIKRLTGLDDAEGDVKEFAHGSAGDGLTGFTVGFEALAEGSDDRVVFPSDQGRHEQDLAQEGVADLRETGLYRVTGLIGVGCQANEGDDLLGAVEAIMRAESNEQMSHRRFAEAWDRGEKIASSTEFGSVVDHLANRGRSLGPRWR